MGVEQLQNILYIFDASGSMAAKMGGRAKIAIAQQVLSDQVEKLPDKDINAGLIVYGHRRKGDCADIEEVVKLKPLVKKDLIDKIRSIHPKGQTPIANSIKVAAEPLKELEEETIIILISDGKETCESDPCGAVQQLKDAGIDFILHVIGFDVTEEEKLQLQCIPKAGGGVYWPVHTAERLDEALKEATKPIIDSVKVQENTEIILDTSVSMKKPFDGITKFEAAVKVLGKVLDLQAAERDNLAFRQFGGPCKGDNTKRLVNFGQSNAVQIRQTLGSLKAEGETTMVASVLGATKDFNDPRFDGVNKRVLIITSGHDSCNPKAFEDIRRALQSAKIRPDFRFIGMDIPPDQQRQLGEIQRVTEGKIHFVKNQQELEKILKWLFEVEPVIADVKNMLNILNSVADDANKSIRLVEQRSFPEAENQISKSQNKLGETDLPIKDLEKRLNRDDFKKLYEFVKVNRGLQNQFLGRVRDMIPLAKEDKIAAYNESINKVNEIISHYNGNIRKIDNIMRQL